MKKSIKLITFALSGVLAMAALAGCSSDDEKEPSLVPLKDAQVGDLVNLGVYEQDNNTSNGKEVIQWHVLDARDDKVLLISTHGLDAQPFSTDLSKADWDSSTLKTWLTGTFAKEAELQGAGELTLLTVDEASKLLDNYRVRTCEATAYAVAQGVAEDSNGCPWWLRSPGGTSGTVAYVESTGHVNDFGHKATAEYNAVRPALWANR